MSLITRQTLTYFGAYFVLGATISSLGPTLPFLASNTGTSLAQLGLLFTLRSAGYLIGSLIGGRLYDHLSGHRLLGGAILAGGFSLALVPEIQVFPLLILVLLVIGLAESTLDVGSNTQLVWAHGARSGPYLNGMFLVAGIGGTLAPLVFSTLGGAWGYRALALVTLPIASWAYFTRAPERQKHEEGRPSSAISPLLFFAFCLLTFIFIGGEVGFSGWIYSYSLALDMGTEKSAGILNALYWLGITLGRAAAIILTTRVRPSRLVLANLIGLVFSLGLILLDPGSLVLLWVGSLSFGIFLAPLFPTTFAFLERKTPITGSAAGVIWASGSFGAMIYPWVMGLQITNMGPVSIMVTLAISFGVSLALFGWISNR
jgi:FHS family Na+ dependent glucose MFS transporter 1